MDDTSQRPNDAGAIRKRRSSILKAVRPARAPLSELEFNVATPTDTTKSRRVSFSRRTGVAEFVTNEATTTWKNLYEEQNQTLETSQEPLDRPTVAQLGNRLIDRQFQEVISIDFDHGKANVSQLQVATGNLDCTTISGLVPSLPQQKFELSHFTDQQSKVFTEDLAISGMGELTDKISFNFSSMQPVGPKRDDLEDMVRDLELQNNLGGFNCPGPNVSEYIEVDLNMTTIAPNQSDMSITDTIHSPKVNVTKNTSTISNKDIILDKENILLNPYVAPKESDNFAVNEDSDKVLVFDGKRLTVQHEKDIMQEAQRNVNPPGSVEDTTTSKLHNLTESMTFDVKNNTDKTINRDFNLSTTNLVNQLLDINEPTISNISMTKAITGKIILNNDKRKTVNYESDNGNISVTQALPTNIINSDNKRHNATVYENNGDLSITQAAPSLILPIANDKRRTIVFETDADVSITQAIPTNLIMAEKENPVSGRRQTIIYDNNENNGDISITQAIPTNLLMPENNPVTARRQTIVDDADISMTQAIPTNLIMVEKENPVSGRRQTIIYDNNENKGDISITQAIPTKLLVSENNPVTARRQTIVYDDNADISMTQTIPYNLILTEKENPVSGRRQTIIYDNNENKGDISITQAIPTNLLMPENNPVTARRQTIVYDDNADISMTQARPTNLIMAKIENPVSGNHIAGRRQTIIYDNNENNGDISITQAIPTNLLMPENNSVTARRQTIVYGDNADISMTQAIPTNLIMAEKENPVSGNHIAGRRQTIIYDNNENNGDISITQAIPTNLLMPENNPVTARRQTIVYDENADISMTQAIPTNTHDIVEREINKKRETIVFDTETTDVNATQAVDHNLILSQPSELIVSGCEANLSKLPHNSDPGRRKTVIFEDGNVSVTQAIPSSITMADKSDQQKRKTIVFETADIPMTNPIPANIINSLKPAGAIQNADDLNKYTGRKVTADDKLIEMDMSVTQSMPTNVLQSQEQEEKRKTMMFEHNNGDTEMTQDENHDSETVNLLMPRILMSDSEQVSETPATTSVESFNRNTNSDDADVSMTDDSKIKLGFETSSSTINNFAQAMMDTSKTTSNVSSYYSIATSKGSENLIKKKEILENCLKIVDLAQRAKSPNLNHLRDTIVYQTVADMNATKPKAIEFIPATMTSDSKEKPSATTLSDKSILQDGQNYFVITPDSKLTIPISSDNEKLIKKVNSDLSKETSNTKPQTSNETISSDLSKIGQELKQTILNDLLDMANASVDIPGDGFDDKSVTAKIDSENPSVIAKDNNPIISPRRTMSRESFFYIKDEEDAVQTENSDEDGKSKRKIDVRLPIVFSKPSDAQLTTSPKEPVTITIQRSPRTSVGNRYFEKVRSPDIKTRSPEPISERRNRFRDVRDAESTRELIEMLSDFTDKEEEHNPLQPMQVEHKEPRRLTLPPRRHSVILSKEDLLNNISLATTMLQKSQFENSSFIDENDTTIEKSCQKNQADVVKTLRFEEDSYSDVAEMVSPLKKTAFGESSYMKERENKGNVIPSYLKEVSDGIKQLMSDLVKPIADTLPFTTLKPDIVPGPQNPSTCSMQIEANLITSSQIDVDTESRSEENVGNSSMMRNRKGIIKSPNRSPSAASPIKATMIHEPSQDAYSKVVIFDRENPLNNVLLAPIDFSAAHKYNPPNVDSEPELRQSRQSSQVKFRQDDSNMDTNTKQYRVETCIAHFNHIPGGDNGVENINSKTSILSKPASVDVEIDSSPNMKTAEANTIIAMKGVKQLLEESSSLTLVEDLDSGSKPSNESVCAYETTNFKVLYSNEDTKLKPDLQSPDEANTMKRRYSPTKPDRNRSVQETTPKQNMKVRKISKSPVDKPKSPKYERKSHESNEKVLERQKSPIKSPKISSPKCQKPSSPIAVQQLITEYHIATMKNENHDQLEGISSGYSGPKEVLSALQNKLGDDVSSIGSRSYKQSPMDWQPELINELSSKNLLIEREGDIDVLAKVDRLPFMGTRDCEWESSTAEAWSFKMLRERLRLTVRFMQPHARFTQSTRRIRGDTPLLIVTVDPLRNESDPVAACCVTFAAYAMRDAATRASQAGDVPALLRRCGGIGRVAARWARTMMHAQVHLAYSLTFDGKLSLKVANTDLRSVFEVTMHIQMERDGDSAPCPRATEVGVHRVIGVPPAEGAVTRALHTTPNDWGHAPNVLWKIFRHLKHQKADATLI